jgi:hypothetical protein
MKDAMRRRTDRLLDVLPHEEIADVGIEPARLGLESQAIRVHAAQQLGHRPWLDATGDRAMVLRQSAVLANPGAVLQKLAQGEGLGSHGRIEVELAVPYQRQRRGSNDRLGEAPPRHDNAGVPLGDDDAPEHFPWLDRITSARAWAHWDDTAASNRTMQADDLSSRLS